MRRSPILAAALLACLSLAACESQVNDDNFAQITTGMTQTQVENLLGGKGEKQEITGANISGYGVAGGSTPSNEFITYIWKNGRNEYSVRFKDGKVVEKVKAGG